MKKQRQMSPQWLFSHLCSMADGIISVVWGVGVTLLLSSRVFEMVFSRHQPVQCPRLQLGCLQGKKGPQLNLGAPTQQARRWDPSGACDGDAGSYLLTHLLHQWPARSYQTLQRMWSDHILPKRPPRCSGASQWDSLSASQPSSQSQECVLRVSGHPLTCLPTASRSPSADLIAGKVPELLEQENARGLLYKSLH